jgi:hypothetical protein
VAGGVSGAIHRKNNDLRHNFDVLSDLLSVVWFMTDSGEGQKQAAVLDAAIPGDDNHALRGTVRVNRGSTRETTMRIASLLRSAR